MQHAKDYSATPASTIAVLLSQYHFRSECTQYINVGPEARHFVQSVQTYGRDSVVVTAAGRLA
jgi:phosphoserine phosphatase